MLSAYGITLSIGALPAILTSPKDQMLRQWRIIYTNGKTTGPALAHIAAGILGYIAYTNAYSTQSLPWIPYATGAASCISIMPYTIIVLLPINSALMDDNERLDGGQKGKLTTEEVTKLVQRWSILNIGRSMIPLAGVTYVMWTILN